MNSKLASILLVLALVLAPAAAFAQVPRDRVSFDGSVTVPAGQVVNDAVSFGGDVTVEGTVLGDAVSFGGSVILREAGQVRGEITAFGGHVRDLRTEGAASPVAREVPSRGELPVRPAADVAPERGPIDAVWEWLQETARSAVAHVLLFLLGLLLMGLSRERLGAMQVTMIRDSLKTAGVGLLGFVAAIASIVLLCVTIVGIPAAVVAGLLLPVATYIGLAAAATVIGAALPIPQLKDREIAQLGAGVVILFVCSVVPFIGKIATVVAACLGFGALIRTRFRGTPPADLAGGPLSDAADPVAS